MSSASLPDPRRGAGLPESIPSPKPHVVAPPPRRPRSRAIGWIAAAAVIAAGVGGFLWQKTQGDGRGGSGPGGPATVATAVIVTGDLDRTVRLTGSISAERFAALLVPQLRGTRGGRGGGGGGMGGGGGAGGGGGRSGGSGGGAGSGSGASGSGSQSASSVTIGTGSGTGTASAGAAPASSNTAISGGGSSSLGAIRGSQNRFGDRKTASSSGSSSSSTSPASGSAPSASSSSVLGSTAGALGTTAGRMGGGGGGGGGGGMTNAMGDFSLILTYLAPGGARVRKGDVVAEFDRQFMMNRIEDYKASVVQSEMNVKKMEADLALAHAAREQQLRIARADVEKAKLDLKTLEVVSDIDAQRLKLAVEEAEAKLKQMLADQRHFEAGQRAQLRVSAIELAQNRIELQRAQTNVDKMVVKAPIDGIVVRQNLRRGMEMATVEQGDQLFPGMMFLQIVDPSSMVLNASINQVDSEALRIGMRAAVKLDAYPGIQLPAKVYSIGAVPVAGRRVNWMKEIRVRLKLEGNDSRIIPDLSASADVTLGQTANATLAPVSAVQTDPGGKAFVMVQAGAEFVRRDVELGMRNSLRVAVLSGLKPGEVVAVPSAAPAPASDQKAAGRENESPDRQGA